MKTTFVAVGDCFITRRIPERGYEGFDELKWIFLIISAGFSQISVSVL